MTAQSISEPVGMVFNFLTVLEVIPPALPNHETKWRCRCECGNIIIAAAYRIRSGVPKSCGCLWRKSMTKHGRANGMEYTSWDAMIQRCTNPNNPAYERYGGRGITVCDRWRDFANFFADMGERPSLKYTLERKDNDGNYEPSNCRWATHAEQNRNSSKTHFVTFNDETLCVTDWAKRIGISAPCLAYRLSHWPLGQALTKRSTRKK